MIKSVLTCCRVVACLLLPAFFNSALALDAPQHDTLTYTHELKPIPQESFQIAKATFLPYIKDSEIGFSGNELKGDYNFTGDCSNKDSLFTSKNCIYPKALVLSSQCPFLPGYYTQCKCLTKFNKTSCNAPYILGGESCEGKYEKCVCPAKVELTCPNDTCTKTCEGNCIAKSCIPTANQTGCTNGTQACDDGCCGTNRKCCIPCTNKITSKPANSSYTYSSCTDGEGSKQIQTGWVCNPGYHEKNGDCEKDCPIDNCSAYTLASCPTNGNCSTCNKTAQDCSKDTQTKYRLDSCASGFVVSGNSCREQTCEEKGQKTCNGSCIATSECCGGCSSGYECDNGSCILACSPKPSETNCTYGSGSCSDGCGGTRLCCKKCLDCSGYKKAATNVCYNLYPQSPEYCINVDVFYSYYDCVGKVYKNYQIDNCGKPCGWNSYWSGKQCYTLTNSPALHVD